MLKNKFRLVHFDGYYSEIFECNSKAKLTRLAHNNGWFKLNNNIIRLNLGDKSFHIESYGIESTVLIVL